MNLSLITILTLALPFGSAFAQFDGSSFKQALKLKKNVYLSDGSFSGGDRNSANFKVTNIRVAANPAGYDRLVIDFANPDASQATLARPPFFLVENDPHEKRVNVTLFGHTRLDFSQQTTLQAAKKAKHIAKIQFLPLVEEDRWIFSIDSQSPVKAEVFELTDPARIIIDLKP